MAWSECGSEEGDMFKVDGKQVCASCLHGGREPFRIYPIGIVRNDIKRIPGSFRVKAEGKKSVIEIFPSQERFMKHLDEEKYITIVFYLHETGNVHSVFCRGWDGKEVGVFASRTPNRTSRIAVSDVKLVSVEGSSITVEGLDAVDGSPVIDIKMSHPRYGMGSGNEKNIKDK